MAFDQLNTVPRDVFQDNVQSMQINAEKAAVSVVDVRSHFGQANYGLSVSPQNAFQPEEPAIEIEPQSDFVHQIDNVCMNLSEGHCKGFAHSKSDIGQLGESCAQAVTELCGALSSKTPEIQPELSPHLAMAAPRPAGLFA